jgi:DNA-binding transcriptional MerR regulator
MARRSTPRRPSRNRTASRNGGQLTFMSRTALCRLSGISERELILWEREELIAPVTVTRLAGRTERLYDASTLQRARLIRTLAEELEVNLPGIDVILHLLDQMGR